MHFSAEERVKRFQEYYRFENARPLLGFFVGSEYPMDQYPCSRKLPTDRALAADDFVSEDYVADEEKLYESYEAAGGDFIWSASSFWGIPWLEAALGCNVYANPETASLYSKAPADFAGSGSIPEFDPDNPWVKKVEPFTNRLF